MRSWESMLTLSIVHFMIYPETMAGEGPISASVEALAKDDFLGAIEITRIKDPAERAKIRAIAKQAGLKLGFGAQPAMLMPKLNLNDPDPAGRAKAVEVMKACMDEAAEMGCARVATLSGKDPGDAERAKGLDLLADSVKSICAYGQDKGIDFTIETFDFDVDKKAILGPSPVCAAFAKRIREDYPTFGLMYDLSHLPLLRENAREALRTLKPYLVHIHVGNAVTIPGKPGYGDLHPRFGYPESANDMPELLDFLKALFEIGYLDPGGAKGIKPWVGIEVKPMPEESTEFVLAHTKRTWKEAWARL
jgi:sugar phosphate isomerase/epimerase